VRQSGGQKEFGSPHRVRGGRALTGRSRRSDAQPAGQWSSLVIIGCEYAPLGAAKLRLRACGGATLRARPAGHVSGRPGRLYHELSCAPSWLVIIGVARAEPLQCSSRNFTRTRRTNTRASFIAEMGRPGRRRAGPKRGLERVRGNKRRLRKNRSSSRNVRACDLNKSNISTSFGRRRPAASHPAPAHSPAARPDEWNPCWKTFPTRPMDASFPFS
jgi:hypothetical protein